MAEHLMLDITASEEETRELGEEEKTAIQNGDKSAGDVLWEKTLEHLQEQGVIREGVKYKDLTKEEQEQVNQKFKEVRELNAGLYSGQIPMEEITTVRMSGEASEEDKQLVQQTLNEKLRQEREAAEQSLQNHLMESSAAGNKPMSRQEAQQAIYNAMGSNSFWDTLLGGVSVLAEKMANQLNNQQVENNKILSLTQPSIYNQSNIFSLIIPVFNLIQNTLEENPNAYPYMNNAIKQYTQNYYSEDLSKEAQSGICVGFAWWALGQYRGKENRDFGKYYYDGITSGNIGYYDPEKDKVNLNYIYSYGDLPEKYGVTNYISHLLQDNGREDLNVYSPVNKDDVATLNASGQTSAILRVNFRNNDDPRGYHSLIAIRDSNNIWRWYDNNNGNGKSKYQRGNKVDWTRVYGLAY